MLIDSIKSLTITWHRFVLPAIFLDTYGSVLLSYSGKLLTKLRMVKAYYTLVGKAQAITAGYDVPSLSKVSPGLNACSETGTVFERVTVSEWRQLGLCGLSLLLLI